jgi:hypothetical protein
MPEFKTLQGILALVDIVNFTGQSNKLGEKFTAQYTAYFQKKIKGMVEKHRFQVIKFLGDAALVFGKEPDNLLGIMLDLFERDKPEDKFGFVSRYRMVAHSGYFQFEIKDGEPVDLVSPEGIKVFRMEKHARTWELVVTQPLYQGLKARLTQKHIEASRMMLNESLKGFDNEDWFPPFYKLKIVKMQTGVSNLLEQRTNELEKDVQVIPVFGNMYPPVSMDQNFINLSLVSGDEAANGTSCLPEELKIQKEEKSLSRLKEIDVPALFARYCKGIIFGLPGAGKTTILRHMAFKEFNTNKTKTENEKQLVLFVPCRDIPLYDEWYKKCYSAASSEPDPEAVLEFMTWVFLFGTIFQRDKKTRFF